MLQRISEIIISIASPLMMRAALREEAKQLYKHVVELGDIERCTLFRHHK